MEQGIASKLTKATRYDQIPKTESEVEDWMQGARAFTEYLIEEIARIKQENRDLKVSLRISQWKLDRAYNGCRAGDHDVIASTDLV